MKKILLAIKIFVLVMIFSANCQAADYYVGTYNSGYDAYFMSETLNFKGGFRNFTVKIKAINNSQIIYIDYEFTGGPGNRDRAPYQTYKNSQGASGDKLVQGTVEYNIFNLANKFWQDKIRGR